MSNESFLAKILFPASYHSFSKASRSLAGAQISSKSFTLSPENKILSSSSRIHTDPAVCPVISYITSFLSPRSKMSPSFIKRNSGFLSFFSSSAILKLPGATAPALSIFFKYLSRSSTFIFSAA